MRLNLSALANVLVSGLRRVDLKGTGLAKAQVSTIRIRPLKIRASDSATQCEKCGLMAVIGMGVLAELMER